MVQIYGSSPYTNYDKQAGVEKAAEAEAFLMEDAGLTADEVAALKAKLGQ